MTTAERAAGIAHAAESFAGWLGEIRADALLELVRLELGDAEILDDFRPRGASLSRAIAPRTILHVVSANTPHAGLQTLIRGLLLGSHNRCKLPTGGLPEVSAFQAALPSALSSLVEFSETLPEPWLANVDAVIVFGDDDTIAHLHERVRPDQIFCGHGHRVSLGVILGDYDDSLVRAAKDASLFDQRGCLSPHVFYVREDSRAYALGLVEAMHIFNGGEGTPSLSPAEAVQIRAVRDDYRFRAANDDRIAVWMSEEGRTLDWTVIHDAANPEFTLFPTGPRDFREAAASRPRRWVGQGVGELERGGVLAAERRACAPGGRAGARGLAHLPAGGNAIPAANVASGRRPGFGVARPLGGFGAVTAPCLAAGSFL